MTKRIVSANGYRYEALTKRELEILFLLAEGLKDQEIAHQLHLAAQTVRWYNSRIYSKLHVNNRVEVVDRARVLGLIERTNDRKRLIHNLPMQITNFVGRQQELNTIAKLLRDENIRLLTLLASGGMGKTRLAIKAASTQQFEDGVYFIPLAPLKVSENLVTTISENIGFMLHGEHPPKQQLMDHLSDKTMLLVLDNFEHLLDGTSLVSDILHAAPKIKILVTSRERLNLHGETVYQLFGLHYLVGTHQDDILAYDAAKLFIQSARRSQVDFDIETNNLEPLIRICQLTEGMPLALELAAGWVDTLSVKQIATELQQGIDFLKTELRDVPDRHRSIRATFERTWQRLTDNERAIFAKLSVFRGGFTLAAAQVIARANAQMFRRLVQKALIQTEGNNRFAVHELLRQFAEEKLVEIGEQPDLQAQHSTYFANFMIDLKQDIKTNRQVEALEAIDYDFENVRTAWFYLIQHNHWDQLVACLHSLWFYCDVRPRAQEAVKMLESAVERVRSAPQSPTHQLALGNLLAHLGWFYTGIGFHSESAIVCDQSVQILRQQDSQEYLIFALYSRLMPASYLNTLAASVRDMQEAISIAQSIGDSYWEGHCLIWLSWAYMDQGKSQQTLQCAEQALAIFEQMDEKWGLYRAYHNLGMAFMILKRYDQARHWLEQALVTSKLFDHVFTIAMINIALADLAIIRHDQDVACKHLRQAMYVLWSAGRTWVMGYPLVYVARIFADRGAFDRAVEILAIIEQYPTNYLQSDRKAQALREELKSMLEPERFAAAWARGLDHGLSTLVTDLLAELVYV